MNLFSHYGEPDIFLRLTGDNIFVDPGHIDFALEKFKENNFDYYKHSEVIDGTDFEIIKWSYFNSLDYIYDNFKKNAEYMTLFLNNNFGSIMSPLDYPDSKFFKKVRLTLDNKIDLENCKSVGEYFQSYDFSYKDLCRYVKNNKIIEPENNFVDKAEKIRPRFKV